MKDFYKQLYFNDINYYNCRFEPLYLIRNPGLKVMHSIKNLF